MNSVTIQGTLTRDPKSGGTYTFLTVRTQEERSSILDVAAFDETARDAASFKEGDLVLIHGRCGVKEDKKLSAIAGRKVWMMQVVASSIEAAGAKKKNEPTAPVVDDDDIPF